MLRAAEDSARPRLVEKTLRLLGGVEEILFVERALYKDGRYFGNFGGDSVNPREWHHAPDGSRLARINLRTRKVAVLVEVAQGDLRVHYDGQKFLFAYRKGGTHNYNLYELNADGTGLKQLTFGEK